MRGCHGYLLLAAAIGEEQRAPALGCSLIVFDLDSAGGFEAQIHSLGHFEEVLNAAQVAFS